MPSVVALPKHSKVLQSKSVWLIGTAAKLLEYRDWCFVSFVRDDGSEVQGLMLLSALMRSCVLTRLFLEICQLEGLADGPCRRDDLSRNNVVITHLSVTVEGIYRHC